MKLFENFVHQYESILSMKKGYSDEEYTKRGYVKHIGILCIIFSIFFGLGYLLGMTENLNYVAYSINAAVFGSFLFIYTEFEEDFKKQFSVEYKPLTAIVVRLAKLLVIQFSITAMLFFFVFGLLVSNIEIIALLLLVVVLLVFLVFVFNRVDNYEDTTKISYSHIFVVTAYYLVGFRVFHFLDIISTVLLFTGVLVILLLVRQVLKQRMIPRRYRQYIRYISYGMVIIGMMFQKDHYGDKATYINFDKFERESFYIGTLMNLTETKELMVPEIRYVAQDDEYYGIADSTVFIFDKSLDFYSERYVSPDIPFDSDSVLYIEENKVLLESIVANGNQYERRIYGITENSVTLVSTEVFDQQINYINEHPAIGHSKEPDLYIAEEINGYVYFESQIGVIKYSIDLEYMGLVEDIEVDYDDNLFKSNGYTLTINTEDSFIIESDTNDLEIFEASIPHGSFIWQYYNYNNTHYINGSGGIVYSFNSDGDLEDYIYSGWYSFERVLFVEDKGYLFISEPSKHAPLEEHIMYQFSLDDMSNYVFNQRTNMFIPDTDIFGYGDIRMHTGHNVFLEFTFLIILVIIPAVVKRNRYSDI